ncbi:MAG: hypothetical protein HY701_04430 [Gemmatimonadetes bacterium]|nr:hypothetical protein [Gemmatimonadota bacterium]
MNGTLFGRWREPVLVWTTASLLAVLLTYPYAWLLGSAGRLDSGDGQFSIWNIAWVARTIIVDPRNLFNANIFYPHRNTLAFSELNLGAGIMAVPVYWLSGGNPYAAHNSVLLLSFVLSAVGAYYLTRHVTGSRGAAAVAGVMFAYCPYIFARTAHIQLMLTAGLPFSLLAFHRLVERQTAGRAVVLGTTLAAQGLSCGYYGYFAGLMVGVGVLYYAIVRRLGGQFRYWVAVAGAALTSVAIVLPFLLPYLALQEDGAFAERTLAEARLYSADWRSYLASPAISHRWLLPLIGAWKDVLFPGFLATVLAAFGVWTGVLGRVEAKDQQTGTAGPASGRETALLYLLIGGLALWASFGPDAGLYTLLFEGLPGFSLLRAPSRLGIVVSLALTVLAAIGLRSLVSARGRYGPALAATLTLAAALELAAVPVRAEPVPPVPVVYRLLARLPDGPVAEFPFFWERQIFYRHVYYMLYSTVHWKPLVNGYSDYIPSDFREMVLPVSSFPARDAFKLLEERGARYVIFHLHFYDARSREKLLEAIEEYQTYLRPLWREGEDWLFEIVKYPA